MAMSTTEFLRQLASDEKNMPRKEPRVDAFPSGSYFEAMGEEIEKNPIGFLPRRTLRPPTPRTK